jgi:hypothetical protein
MPVVRRGDLVEDLAVSTELDIARHGWNVDDAPAEADLRPLDQGPFAPEPV